MFVVEVHSGNHLLCLHKRTIGKFREQLNENDTKDIFNFKYTHSHSFSTFTSCVT